MIEYWLKLNNKTKKIRYIRIKNSWRFHHIGDEIIRITIGSNHGLPINPKYPKNQIVMDFKKRDEIVKYGVKCTLKR